MSSVINANPIVYDVSLVPTRQSKAAEATFILEYKDLELYNLALSPEYKDANEFKQKTIVVPQSQKDASIIKPSKYNQSYGSAEKEEEEEEEEEEIDALEIYDLICDISDPEHPLSLAALGVVNIGDINVGNFGEKSEDLCEVIVKITPTINHCSLATLIGLGIRVRLERCLPPRFRIIILLKEGSHQSEKQVNSQLNDKERISAACENNQLLSVISTMLSTCK